MPFKRNITGGTDAESRKSGANGETASKKGKILPESGEG